LTAYFVETEIWIAICISCSQNKALSSSLCPNSPGWKK
jgi:hypothetical protein